MTTSINPTINAFHQALSEVNGNNLPQIRRLTDLAEELKKNGAVSVVDGIEGHLNKSPYKLPLMYVIDSILKNVRKPNDYNSLFAKKIVSMFELAFRQADDQIRLSLYKLRVNWSTIGLFLPSKLYALDIQIKRIDDAWPILNPKNHVQKDPVVVHNEENVKKSGGQKRKNEQEIENASKRSPTQAFAPNLAQIPTSLVPFSSTVVVPQAQQQIEIQMEIKEEKKDVFALLRNLEKSGLLETSSSNGNGERHQNQNQMGCQNGKKRNRNRNRQNNSRFQQASMALAPLVDSAPALAPISCPPESIISFSIGILRIRYTSVVDSLVAKRSDSCKICGLKLDDSNGRSKLYKDHMDHHLRLNLGMIKSSEVKQRQWYPSASTWLTSKKEITVPEKMEKVGIVDNLGVESTGHKIKDCSVCGERFEEYYVDEDETWRFRGTVMVKAMIVHSGCESDVGNSDGCFLDQIKKERTSDFSIAAF